MLEADVLATMLDLKKRVEYLESQNAERDQRMQHLEDTIEELRAKKHEVYYQRKLEELLGGKHFDTPEGQIDVLTNTGLYEIKGWKNYKHAYGQLERYAAYVPGKQLGLIFFGKCHLKKEVKQKYLDDYRRKNVDVYQLHDTPDGNVLLDLLNPRPANMQFVVDNQGDVNRVISKFIAEKCDLQPPNRNYKVFATELWKTFCDWQTKKKVTPLIRHNDFCKSIDRITDYDRAKKVRVDSQNNTGWCGIRLKENTSDEVV